MSTASALLAIEGSTPIGEVMYHYRRPIELSRPVTALADNISKIVSSLYSLHAALTQAYGVSSVQVHYLNRTKLLPLQVRPWQWLSQSKRAPIEAPTRPNADTVSSIRHAFTSSLEALHDCSKYLDEMASYWDSHLRKIANAPTVAISDLKNEVVKPSRT